MKKSIALLLSSFLLFSLAACGGASEPPDLTGEWTQTNSNLDETYQVATIQDNMIVIQWVSDGGDTKMLYWAGTFEAPTTAEEPYVWESVNDTKQTAGALMASSSDTKAFTYEDGEISYEVTTMGVTMTMRLEKET